MDAAATAVDRMADVFDDWASMFDAPWAGQPVGQWVGQSRFAGPRDEHEYFAMVPA